jgi:hypothetical protein
VTPLACVHVAPLSVVTQIWPFVVPVVTLGDASSATASPLVPVDAIDHTYGASIEPVAIDTTWNDPPPSSDRYRPLFVAANTTPFCTTTCGMTVESPRNTGDDQLSPPSLDLTRPMPVPSNGSPRPR